VIYKKLGANTVPGEHVRLVQSEQPQAPADTVLDVSPELLSALRAVAEKPYVINFDPRIDVNLDGVVEAIRAKEATVNVKCEPVVTVQAAQINFDRLYWPLVAIAAFLMVDVILGMYGIYPR